MTSIIDWLYSKCIGELCHIVGLTFRYATLFVFRIGVVSMIFAKCIGIQHQDHDIVLEAHIKIGCHCILISRLTQEG
jgi:hypothetical protein